MMCRFKIAEMKLAVCMEYMPVGPNFNIDCYWGKKHYRYLLKNQELKYNCILLQEPL
jgi:hypothetical protein